MSVHRRRVGGSNRAYDGNVTTGFFGTLIANPWISFRLNATYDDVGIVQLWPFIDSKMRNVTVAVSATKGPFVGTICEEGVTVTDSVKSFNISCPPTPGAQWVTLYRRSQSESISVGEIQVSRGGWCMRMGLPAEQPPSANHLHPTHPAHGARAGILHGPPPPPPSHH